MSWVYFDLRNKNTYPKNNEPVIVAYSGYCGEKIVTVGCIDKVNNSIKLQIDGELVSYKLTGLVAWRSMPEYPSEFDSEGDKSVVQTICMGKSRMWSNREDALEFFERALRFSDGDVKLHYLNVYMDLKSGLRVCKDVEG